MIAGSGFGEAGTCYVSLLPSTQYPVLVMRWHLPYAVVVTRPLRGTPTQPSTAALFRDPGLT